MKTIFYLILICLLFPLHKDVLAANTDFFKHPEELILYNENQSSAKSLKKCAMVDTDQYSCLLVESPFIGQMTNEVSVEDIMNKTMASKESYLKTFKSVLKLMPQEVLMMFGSVNAVVISERIKPSFYSYTSGAIYISSSYLWKTPEEKALSEKARDHRDDYGSPLGFGEETDYYKNGKSLHGLSKLKERTDSDLLPLLFKVLVHELSHANDFFPKSFYTGRELPISKTFSEVANSRLGEGLLLSQKIRLSSHLMERMSEIFDYGKEPTGVEINMDPQYVVRDYIDGEASDLYAYANAREDLAMLVENNLMFYFFNYESRTVFIKYPRPNFKAPKNYKKPVLGGIKHKIAAPQVKERSESVLDMIFDTQFAQKVMDKLEGTQPKVIPKNMSWDNINKL